MNPHYNQNYTREQIEVILNEIKGCVKNYKYTIAMNENRKENVEFINEYNIRSEKLKSILLQIEADDFCHTLKNTNPGFEKEILYVFVLKVQLFNADGNEENVDVYIKFNIIDLPLGARTVVFLFIN